MTSEANLLTVSLDPLADPNDAAERLEDLALSAGLPVGQVNTSGEIRAAADGLLSLISNGLIASQLPRGYSAVGIAIWIVVGLAIGAIGASRPACTPHA